jgi:hypothetical protein
VLWSEREKRENAERKRKEKRRVWKLVNNWFLFFKMVIEEGTDNTVALM